MSTYGPTGNEGSRDDGGYGEQTYGVQENEPSRHGPGNEGSRGNGGYGGETHGVQENEPSRHGTGNEGSRGNGGYGEGNYGVRENQPSRHRPGNGSNNGYGVGTHGVRGNQPSMHGGDINLFVQATRNPIPMKANSNWTLNELHQQAALTCRMDSSQCYSTCVGIQLSGSQRVYHTSIQEGSTISVNARLRGG
ncbi:N66 matrix protein-like [Lytechinus pictus]|uniref:N66 matrix protein-like n=1 Tax=Lytechinus pictus TaxID=7653 RepID=UPI00240D9D6D|nr:N66 matrix protein-like [Lytechinus pictus]